jgi:hypothetical protein
MKPCDQWRRKLADHVLGAPADLELATHLEKCAACSAARVEWQQRVEQIDAGIRQLAASEPSPGSASRLMAEVRSRRLRRSRLLAWSTAVPALALILVAAAGGTIWMVEEQRKETERALSAATAIASWESPTQGLLRSPTDQWFQSVPRLGESFYDLKANALKKEKDNP